LNIDYVYRTSHIVEPGETLAAQSMKKFAGGKGLNQGIALARAGLPVWMAGKLGSNIELPQQALINSNINTDYLSQDKSLTTGHTVIQVTSTGQNSIIYLPGANACIKSAEITNVLVNFGKGDVIILQNEINKVPEIIRSASSQGMTVAFNPSPFESEIVTYPLDLVDILFVNETEGKKMTNSVNPLDILQLIKNLYGINHVVLTLGDRGAMTLFDGEVFKEPAVKVDVIDTTGAGDTFTGYYLAGLNQTNDCQTALKLAVRSAGLAVSRPGAASAIPTLCEVN
jgi:ribokinase